LSRLRVVFPQIHAVVGSLYRQNPLLLLAEFQDSREVIFLPFCTVLKRFCATLCFPAFFLLFFQREMAATDNEDSTTEKQSEQESSTLISVLTSMKASIDSGNSLLQELVSHKRSSPDDKIQTSKRRKSCSASQKAKAMSSGRRGRKRCFRGSEYAASP